MWSVTTFGSGLVAVGSASGIDPAFHGTGDAAAWISADGFAWSRVPHDPEAFAAPADWSGAWMASVTAGGPGLVAVGATAQLQAMGEEAMWTSPDGITWTLLPQSHPSGCFAEMNSVTAGEFGVVAAGRMAG